MKTPPSLFSTAQVTRAKGATRLFVPAFREDPKQLRLIDAPLDAIERQTKCADRAKGAGLDASPMVITGRTIYQVPTHSGVVA